MTDNHDPAHPNDPQAPGDAGNEATPGNTRSDAPEMDDSIGNRLAPGEPPRGAIAADEEEEESPEDSIGNRLDAPDPNAAILAGQNVTGGAASGAAAATGPGGAKKKRKRGKKGGGDRAHAAAGEGGASGGGGPRPAHAGGGGGEAQRRPFHVGDKVRARLISLGEAGALVDLWGKEKGVIDLRELQVEGQPEPSSGDSVDVVVMQDGSRGGNVVVTRDPQRAERAKEAVQHAFQHNEVIEGLVTGVNRGGLEVDLAGIRAFCPSSQIDARFPPSVSPKALVLTRQKFKITSIVDDGKEAIVSRRALVEAELRARAEEARQHIQVGSVVKGKVVSVKEYGVFLDLGGIEGMIHITELSHIRGARPQDLVKVGEEIEAKVLKITGGQKPDEKPEAATPAATEGEDHEAIAATEQALADHDEEHAEEEHADGEAAPATGEQEAATAEAQPAVQGAKEKPAKQPRKEKKKLRSRTEGLPRVVLSRRAVEPDPWAGIEKKFPSGSVHTGKVARMQPFGAFIELLPGVDGLLHVSELGEGKRIEHPNEVLKDGQTVNVRVERVEKGAKRISLSLVPEGVTEADLKKAVVPRVGNIVKAKIVEHENNGLMWAQIENSIGKTGKGLIPPNESNQPRGTDLRKAYPLGTEVTVKVVEMERGRPKLSIKAALKDEERQAYRAYQRETASKPVGTSLADKLRAKLGNIGGGGSGR
jgi:small subunit ribosomal protein S1